jgi:hypothetical protein
MRTWIAGLLTFAALQTGGTSTLRLTFRGPDAEVVHPDRVTLLLDWWGGGEREAIPRSGDAAILNTDAGRFGEPKARPNEPSRILIEAKGYVSSLSEPFDWPSKPFPAAIAFRGGVKSIRSGDAQELQIRLRRPQPRALRFVDQDAVPAAGIVVNVSMFWTRQNHCGVFEGDPLMSGVTDAQGRMTVPDGDFDYAVELPNDIDSVVFDAESVFYEKIVKATGPETTVVVHRFKRHAVTVEIVAQDERPEGLMVVGATRYPGCMNPGIYWLGTADSKGLVNVRAFSSDQYRDVALCRGDKELWRAPATAFDKISARIVLDPTYKSPDPTTDLCANRRAP